MVKKSRDDIKAWKQALVDQAEKKIMGLTSSEKFQDYLKTMAKFHKYSARNINLIFSQDARASLVAGYKQWQRDFNRKVQKGAKAIRIAAPITKGLTAEEQAKMETDRKTAIVGYRYLPVFDVRDTKGDPFTKATDFINDQLSEHRDVEQVYQAFKDYLNTNTDLKVTERAITESNARGYFDPGKNTIVIDNQVTDSAMKLKTLYHEYAHSQLHGLTQEFSSYPREYQETQAEAVAYVSMQNLGIDTGEYSLGYVATWAKDKDVIHQALSQIHDVSNKTIEISDDLVRGLQREQRIEQSQNEAFKQEVVPEFQEWKPEMGLAASDQILQQKKDYWKGIFERSKAHGFEVTDSEGHTRITLTKSSRPGVDWQLTQYDSNGTYGHTDIVGALNQPEVQAKIMSRLIYKSEYVVKYLETQSMAQPMAKDDSVTQDINDTHEMYQPVSSLNEVRESLVQTPTVLEKIKPSQAPFVEEIASKAKFAHFYDYDEVGHEYSAYSTKEGDTFYECGAEDYVDEDNLKDYLTSALNDNEITIENVIGPKLATKLTDKTQKFVNEHLTNDGLQQQINGLKRLKSVVNPSQIAKVNNSLQLANR